MSEPTPPPSSTVTPPRKPVNKLARISLIIAVIAFVLGLIPFVGFISWLIAAAAIVVAIIALTRKNLPKGMAVGGLIIGAIALIVGPSVAAASVVGAVVAGTNEAAGPTSAASAPAEPLDTAQPTDDAAAPSEPASEAPSEAPAPAVATKTYNGSGDKVIKLDLSDPVIMNFTCSSCSGNTSVKTDSGTETLPVNVIGSYSGRHLLNATDGSLLTRIVINADAKWKLTLKDPIVADIKRVEVGDTLKGKGDDVVFVNDGVTDSDVRNQGEGNFAIVSYGGSDSLPVNEIGSYKGNVVLDGPALAQVESDGSWSIKGNG